jgi:predicted metal-dependent peptidase
MISERIGKIVLGVDTSGSVGVKELNVFLSEVKALADELHPESIDLMYWGSSVVAHEVYTEGMMDTLVQSTRPVNGGGTDPRCVSDKIRDLGMSPECIIILTDGCIGDWGTEWNAPVLWVVAGNPSATAPVGKTIHIKLD